MRREIAYPLLALAILLLVAIVAYHFLEGWDWLTSTLYATATVTTIGYNAVSPESFYGKIFTIFFMVGGVATGFYALVQLAQLAIQQMRLLLPLYQRRNQSLALQ